MSARRRPLHRDDLNIETTLRRATQQAPEFKETLP